ncbi:hypothetical protein HYV64_03980 [Candidatus Shapirobacteria bacterium]|nr:hypothetical protein [Candidatus Shapirobacteria bacterium]
MRKSLLITYLVLTVVFGFNSRVMAVGEPAKEGQLCGGIAGIICASGLTCKYSNNTGVDRSGVCVRVLTPTPRRPAQEGQLCGGIAGTICASGLKCEMNRCGDGGQKCPDGSGVCVKMATPTPVRLAQEGQVCGGISGIMCASGLTCKYSSNTGTDRSGVCVKSVAKVTPTCVPRPACLDLPNPCRMPELPEYCRKPRVTPTCVPRPACLDLPNPCRMPELPEYCPKRGVKGDANGDSKVDLADFSIWKKEYIGEIKTKRADFNGDSKVDLADFSIWKTGYLVNIKK